MKNTRSADVYADPIDVTENFDVLTNVVIKRVHCISGMNLIFLRFIET